MAIETTLLGFQKPDGDEALANGDNVISANAQTAEDRLQEDRTRLGNIEYKLTVSNIALDTDGTPYISFGSASVKVLQDTDGTPYYTAA